jgi:large subunit ribosomal protein L15
MQIHEIQRQHPNTRSQQLGRGGRRGKTSGRGHKGQKARAGHKIRPQFRDEMARMPRHRGRGKNKQTSIKDKPVTVNVAMLSATFSSGDEVTPQTLMERGVVELSRGENSNVKILADGELSVKLSVKGCSVSASAREKIEQAGGSVA